MGPKKDLDESSGSSSGGNTVLNARVLGAIEKFDPETDKWQRYEARLQQNFVANDVEDAKKKSILLTCVGNSVSDLLWDLCPGSTGRFQILVQKSVRHFEELLRATDQRNCGKFQILPTKAET
jgi:hypothetical protein